MLLASWICTFTMCSIGLTAPIEVDNKTPADFKENRVGQCWALWKIPPLVVILFLTDLVKSCGMELNTQECVNRKKLKDHTFWKWKSINDLSLDLGLRVAAVLLLCEVTNCRLEAWESCYTTHTGFRPRSSHGGHWWKLRSEWHKVWDLETLSRLPMLMGWSGIDSLNSAPTLDSSMSRRAQRGTGRLYQHQDKGKTQGSPWVINSANSQTASLFDPILNDPFLHSSLAVCSSEKRCCRVLQLFSFFPN